MRSLEEINALRRAAHREGARLAMERRAALAEYRACPMTDYRRAFVRAYDATVAQKTESRVLTLAWAWLRGVPRSHVEGCVPRNFYYWWLAQEVTRQLMPQATYTDRAEPVESVRDWLVAEAPK